MGNPIDYWYQKYLALKAKMDEMTAGEEHLASVRKMSPNDLEEYASNAGFDYVDDIEVEEPGHRFNDHDVEFAHRDGIIAGAKWQKEQMMKEAVEYEVGMHGEPIKITFDKYVQRAKGIFPGDKIKIIIVKEEKNGTE